MSKAELHQLTRLEIVNAKASTRPYTLVGGLPTQMNAKSLTASRM